MNRVLLFLPAFFIWNICLSQYHLKEHIGQKTIPSDKDPMCAITNYLGSFAVSGYKVSDTVHDFTLYDNDLKEYTLSNILKDGKPVVLVSSSYTCPVFRGKVNVLNELYKLYKEKVNFYIVYTVEAHPNIDISPYFGRVNTGGANVNSGILYRQPIVYRDRIKIVEDMLSAMVIEPPVIVDGPCNEWWLHYGPAPNNMTFINSDGTVFAKHDWFNRSPNDLDCDIKKLLNGVNDCNNLAEGKFELQIIGDTIINGLTEEVLYGKGLLKNTSKSRVNIRAIRLKKNIPSGWITSMCLDVCYGPDTDTAEFYLDAGQHLEFFIDFITDAKPSSGSIRMGFVNIADGTNRFGVSYRANTLISRVNNTSTSSMYSYPNPFKDYIRIESNDQLSQITISNSQGHIFQNFDPAFVELSTINWPVGLYYFNYYDNSGSRIKSEKRVKF
ncbi:MAG: T9SS type A sorting domain-containing protein [Saprospiraceae bacterium]|nr:T9SS type A sorting domain-containing protein [Saprospiraceae bacterium]